MTVFCLIVHYVTGNLSDVKSSNSYFPWEWTQCCVQEVLKGTVMQLWVQILGERHLLQDCPTIIIVTGPILCLHVGFAGFNFWFN